MKNKEHSLSWIERLSNALLREPQDREQLISILHDAEENHLLDADALSMMEGVLHVSELKARDIMIPKSDIIALQYDNDYPHLLHTVIESGHSRFPVIGEEADTVIGMLIAKDLLRHPTNFNLQALLRPAIIVPESKRLDVLLKEFRSTRNHMAMVVDEYGSLTGLVTMEDILEQIVGDIEDETDLEETNHIEKKDDHHYTINALTPLEDFNKYFQIELATDEFDTIGGWLLGQFDHIPQVGETVTFREFHFTIIKSDQRRIISCQLVVDEPRSR